LKIPKAIMASLTIPSMMFETLAVSSAHRIRLLERTGGAPDAE